MARKKNPPSMNVSFPNKHKVQPLGLKGIGIGDTLTCTVTGKLVRIEANASEWDPGTHMTLEIKKFEIDADGDPVSMGDAVDASVYKV